MKFPNKLEKLNLRLATISGALVMVIGFLAVFEVIMRGVFHRPTVWTMDISQFTLIWAIFIGSGYAFQEHGHVRVDLFTERLPLKLRRITSIAAYLFALIFVTVLCYSSVLMLIRSITLKKLTISMVQIPQWILIISMLLGGVMMIITLVCIIFDLVGKNEKYL